MPFDVHTDPDQLSLHAQGASPAEDRELDRPLQCHDRKSVPLDDERQAAGGMGGPSGLGFTA